MKRAMCGMLLAAAGLVLTAAAGPSPHAGNDRTVTGLGTIRFGHEDNGVAMFDFNIDGSAAKPKGKLLCAAEAHGAMVLYPDIIIRVEEITRLHFEGRKARIEAEGTLHDEHVMVFVTVYDGEGTSQPDRFGIRTVTEHGDDDDDHGNFHAEGVLYSGDVRIGTAN